MGWGGETRTKAIHRSCKHLLTVVLTVEPGSGGKEVASNSKLEGTMLGLLSLADWVPALC